MWRYQADGDELGPVSEEDMKALADEGRLTPDTLVNGSHMLGWAPARETALAAFWPEIAAEAKAAASAAIDDRPMGALWLWLRGGLYAYLAAAVVLIVALLADVLVLRALGDDPLALDETFYVVVTANDLFLAISWFVMGAVQIVVMVLWARVTYRAMRNLHQREAAGVTMGPGWAVGWYFVPIASLWKPLQGIRQIWRASSSPADPVMVRVPSVISWWWALWIVTNIMGNISFRLDLQSGWFNSTEDLDFEMMQAIDLLDIAISAIEIPMVLLALWFWSRIARMQDTQYAARVYE